MRVKDIFNGFDEKQLFPPKAAVTDNTAQVSNIIDLAACSMALLALTTGNLTDADATFAVLLEEGDDSALADAATVDAADMIGTAALAGFTFADDNKCRKLGYIGSKRYIRMTVTPSNNTGNLFLAGIALLAKKTMATANPPT